MGSYIATSVVSSKEIFDFLALCQTKVLSMHLELYSFCVESECYFPFETLLISTIQ